MNLIILIALIILVLSITFMSIVLNKSVKKTLYAYRNITLSGGIMYLFIQAVVLLSNYVSLLIDHKTVSPKDLFYMLIEFPRDFSYFAVPVILVVSLMLLVSNIALIRHEGFRIGNLWGVIMGGIFIGGTILLTVVFGLIYRHILVPTGLSEYRLFLCIYNFTLLFFVTVICFYECVLAGTALIGYAAAKHIPAYDKDYIIILGCSISKEGGLLPLLKARTNRAIRFAWDQEIATGNKVMYVPSGGQGSNEIISEGSAMELYLLSHGAESDEVYPEKASENTYENMLYSKRIIDSLKSDAKIAFATTNYHVLRSGILARHAGFDAEGIASKTKWYFWPNGFVREFFGILAINKKAHVVTISTCAAICVILGVFSFFASL